MHGKLAAVLLVAILTAPLQGMTEPLAGDREKPLAVAVVDTVLVADDSSAEAALDSAITTSPDNPRLLAQRGFLKLRKGSPDQALDDFRRALESAALTAEERRTISLAVADILARKGEYRQGAATLAPYDRADDPVASGKYRAHLLAAGEELPRTAASSTSLERDRVTSQELASMAYDMVRLGRDAQALALFDHAETLAPLSTAQAADAAYAACRALRNDAAVAYLQKAVDRWHASPPQDRPFGEKELFGLRRLSDDIQRHWGARGGMMTVLDEGFSQGSLEVYYQPEGIGYRNGAQFQFFASVYQTLFTGIDETSSDTAQASLGMRWKPFSAYNLVLSGERLFKLGSSAVDDTLLRLGFSDDMGTDLNPVDRYWPYGTIFAEAAQFVEHDRTVLTAEGRLGISSRPAQRFPTLVTTPFLSATAQHDSAEDQEDTTAAGAGVATRYWFRETSYRAPASWVELSLQHRFRLSGDDRSEGTFLQFLFSL
jgi:tetratricopeptide (TPR) repeat protein